MKPSLPFPSDFLPPAASADHLRAQMARVSAIFDPFGIYATLAEVAGAWAASPMLAGAASAKLALELASFQTCVVNSALKLTPPTYVSAVPEDERFTDPAWNEAPYSLLKQYYLICTHWLEDMLYETPGVTDKQKRKAAFWVRQWLNLISPSNVPALNPVVIKRLLETGGQSLVDGLRNWAGDAGTGDIAMVDGASFEVGRNLAAARGAVVFRNELLEVIHYEPMAEKVHAVPIVIVAPWINKFYILDLNDKKSLIRHLLRQGYDVYVTSWKNIGPAMSGTTFDDYLIKGVARAVDTAREISGSRHVHGVGYCLGGTALASLMAWYNREYPNPDDVPVSSWTTFTTLVDFSQPGDIEVFIDEQAIEAIERIMESQGYLDGKAMAQAFRMLRSNSLIWHYFVHNYLLGETPMAFDVLYWNVDSTRLPRAMHSFYLREFYLNNKLIRKDGVTLAGHPIDFSRIKQPLYAVGCEEDHIAPWKSTYALAGAVGGPARYTLSTSGHILGIINPPVNPPKRAYWTGEANGLPAEGWKARQKQQPGTWWDDWLTWLGTQCGELVDARPIASAGLPKLCDAPGTYVLEP